VGTKKANELGIYDMSGNMWEWCSDWAALYTDKPEIDPTGPPTGTYRIVRGGCYRNPSESQGVTTRVVAIPPSGTGYIGFRLAHP